MGSILTVSGEAGRARLSGGEGDNNKALILKYCKSITNLSMNTQSVMSILLKLASE